MDTDFYMGILYVCSRLFCVQEKREYSDAESVEENYEKDNTFVMFCYDCNWTYVAYNCGCPGG